MTFELRGQTLWNSIPPDFLQIHWHPASSSTSDPISADNAGNASTLPTIFLQRSNSGFRIVMLDTTYGEECQTNIKCLDRILVRGMSVLIHFTSRLWIEWIGILRDERVVALYFSNVNTRPSSSKGGSPSLRVSFLLQTAILDQSSYERYPFSHPDTLSEGRS